MLTIEPLKKLDWAFADDTTDYLTHGFHQYPARFIPQIPRTLIAALSAEGEEILDPFCGGGTALVEATLLGRHSVGNDINPVAALVSKVKTTPLGRGQFLQLDRWIDKVQELVDGLTNQTALFRSEPPRLTVPDIPNIDHWFAPHVQSELALITGEIRGIDDRDLQDLCWVALSSIVVSVSYQDSETRYARREKVIQPGETFARFVRKFKDMRTKMEEYVAARKPVRARVILGDARRLSGVRGGSIHLIVTSPPYPNAFDYHLYHRHRLFWLGFDPRDLMKAEIGSHLNYQRNGENIEQFKEDMWPCLAEMRRVLKKGRYCVIVIGDSIFDGRVIRNDSLLTGLAAEAGFVLDTKITRPIHPTKRSLPIPARRAARESILLLRKPRDA